MPTNWSENQLRVFAWGASGKGSARVDAVAGSGKTTTLEELVRRIDAQATSEGRRTSIVFCAYNKAISEEIKSRVSDVRSVKVNTFHGLGMGAWMKVTDGKAKVDDKKVYQILDGSKIPEDFHTFVKKAVSIAKGHAIGVLRPMDDVNAWWNLVTHYELEETLTDVFEDRLVVGDDTMEKVIAEALGYAKATLLQSIKADREIIDYDDMVYAPLIHNARFWMNNWVLVDEAQDTNPARRALARKMLLPGGRLIAVGDPHQAIYGFTGADADALDLIEKEFNCVRLPLNVTYRCPKSVVKVAQQWVNHIEAAPTAPEGQVITMTSENFDANTSALLPSDAILCRNMKPLVELAYRLIRRQVSCHVEGREIGEGLIALARRWKIKSLVKLTDKLADYRDKESGRLMAKGQEQKAESLVDRVETVLVIAASLPPKAVVEDLCEAITKLFGNAASPEEKRRPTLTLSTVHKSKGREWDRVFLLGRDRFMPSRYARQDWQMGQEKNLMYVAVTRAKSTLVEITLNGSKEGK